ncbi:MAG: helix-turn-helix transcriptional regulator [Promethearchaeota archaeon]
MSESEIKIQNFTKFFILTLLKSRESVTGYFILKQLERELKITASPTYVYNFLKQLKEKGFVEDVKKSKSKRAGGYKLTTSGHIFVEKMFRRFDNLIDVAIQSKLKICASCGVKLYDQYHTEKIGGEEMKFCCIHCAKAYKKSGLHSH